MSSTQTALDLRVRRSPPKVQLVLLGWNSAIAHDLDVIEADVAGYVATASEQGFGIHDMLQDVIDKYRHFFMPCGDAEAIEQDGRSVVVFYLRARKGL